MSNIVDIVFIPYTNMRNCHAKYYLWEKGDSILNKK